MPASGGFWFDCARSVGPAPKAPHYKSWMPEFQPDSGRAPMGRRPAPYQHKINREAFRHREMREVCPVAMLTIKSQLIVARRLAKKGVQNPAKDVVLGRFPRRKAAFREGDDVIFVRPGPRRCSVEGRGEVLCFPDKKKLFVAIDRSKALHKPPLLRFIDVVPVGDAFVCPDA